MRIVHLGLSGAVLLLLAVSPATAGNSAFSLPHRVVTPIDAGQDVSQSVRLKSENLPHVWTHQKKLPQPSHEGLLKKLGPADARPPRVGFNRDLSPSGEPLSLGENLEWEYLSDGGWLALLEIESSGARALRAGILVHSIPQGLEIRFFGRDLDRVHPVRGSDVRRIIERNRAADGDTAEANTFWSPVIDGDRIGLEFYLPAPHNPQEVRATLPSISHLVYSPLSGAVAEGLQQRVGGSAACNLDVMCHTDDWDLSSRAVARMVFSVGSGSALCTGTLLNSDSGEPYFLTANHCLDTQSSASSLSTFWFYRSSECDGGTLDSGTETRSGGAELLYTGPANDTTLLLLDDLPPAGAVYSGWSTETLNLNESATGIHHPRGDLQKISFGSVRGFSNCTEFDASGRFFCSPATVEASEFVDVLFTQGTAEPGSSGSAIFAGNGPSVVGVLYGGNSSCSNPSGNNIYGRFDRVFETGNFEQWLLGGGSPDTTPPTVPGNVSAQATGSKEVSLSWSASTDSGGSGLAGYKVERCTGASCANFTQVRETDASTTSFNDTGLSADTTYRYRVRAFDGAGNHSGFSNIASATTRASTDILDNRFFVEQQYRDFLGREGDEGGINFWVQELEAGRVTRAGLVEAFFNSFEFQASIAPVARLYFAYFNRIPDYPGLQFWVGELQGGRSLIEMSNEFASSPEFIATYGRLTNGEFVDLVYWNVLGRAPEPDGRVFWIGELEAGMSRGEVMVRFSESEEYRGRSFEAVQVTMMYVSMLRRVPEQEGFDFWIAELASGGSILELVGGFLVSPEYLGRFDDSGAGDAGGDDNGAGDAGDDDNGDGDAGGAAPANDR